MSDWLDRKDVCTRCLSGIDEKNTGRCSTCAGMDDERAAWMKKTRFGLELLDEPIQEKR